METRLKVKGTVSQIAYLFDLHGIRSYQRTSIGEKENTYEVIIRHSEEFTIPSTIKTLTALKNTLEEFGHIEKDETIIPEEFKIDDKVMFRFTNKNEFITFFADDKGKHRDLSWEYMRMPLKVIDIQKGSFKQLSGFFVSYQDKPITGDDGKPFLFEPCYFVEYDKNAL